MRYFLMNQSYEFVEVTKEDYDNPDYNLFIENKVIVDNDGLVTMNLYNVAVCELARLVTILSNDHHQFDIIDIHIDRGADYRT